MDRCREVMNLLGGFMDRELDSADEARVQAHLDACPGCRRELEGLSRVDKAFRSAAAPEVSDSEWEKVSAALDEAMRAPRREARRASPARGWFGGWALPATALAAAAVVMAAVLFGLSGTTTQSPGIEITNLETEPGYEVGVDLPAQDGDFLIIDVTNSE